MATAAAFFAGVAVVIDRVARSVDDRTHAPESETTSAPSEHVAQDLIEARQVPSDIASAVSAPRAQGVTDRAVRDAVLEGPPADDPKLPATWSPGRRTR